MESAINNSAWLNSCYSGTASATIGTTTGGTVSSTLHLSDEDILWARWSNNHAEPCTLNGTASNFTIKPDNPILTSKPFIFELSKGQFHVNITDYKVIKDTVVIVTFADGTKEKAVCSPNDEFNLERGIEICVLKKMLGGTKQYNSLIKSALKKVNEIDANKQKEAEEKELEKRRKAKAAERRAKRKEKKRQEQVDMQAEAFLKGMKMYDESVATKPDVDLDENKEIE